MGPPMPPFGPRPTPEEIVLWTEHVKEALEIEATLRKGMPWPASAQKWAESMKLGAEIIHACHNNHPRYDAFKPLGFQQWCKLRFDMVNLLQSFKKRGFGADVPLAGFILELKGFKVFTGAELIEIEREEPSPTMRRLLRALAEFMRDTPLARAMLEALRSAEEFVDFEGMYMHFSVVKELLCRKDGTMHLEPSSMSDAVKKLFMLQFPETTTAFRHGKP